MADQGSCWIPVAPGAPSDPSKSAEVQPAKKTIFSVPYEIRTKSAKSRGLEKDGRRERISGFCRGAAVQSFVREAPRLLGIFPRWRAGREYFVRRGWRRERDSNPRYGSDAGFATVPAAQIEQRRPHRPAPDDAADRHKRAGLHSSRIRQHEKFGERFGMRLVI
jgi:hypothetical protein